MQRILATVPTAYWPLGDTAGPIADEKVGTTVNVDVLDNGGFETPGAPIFDRWLHTVGDGALADELVLVHGGAHALKITSGPSSNTWAYQVTIPVRPGIECTIVLWTRGDGANSGRYGVYDDTNGAWIITLTSLAVPGVVYTQKTLTFTPPAGCILVRFYLACPTVNGGIAYFDDVSLTYDQPFDGVYSSAGVTYGVAGVLPGETAVEVDGNDTYVRVGYQAIDSVFNGDKGSAIAWGKVDGAARWTDATTMRYLWHPKATDDITYYLVLGKNQVNHQLEWRRRAGAGIFQPTYTFTPAGILTWFCMGMTWDISVPEAACYLYAPGEVPFTTVYSGSPASGMDAWGAHPVDGNNHLLLAGTLTTQEWMGCGAHIAYWAGRVLSASEMQYVMWA